MRNPVIRIVCLVLGVCGLAQADLNDGLVAYYPFNGNANDESGNGNDGVVNGATLTSDRFGDVDNTYLFEGNDYINFGDKLDIDDNAFQGIEVIIGSMTHNERSRPHLMNHSRKIRIAKGSGTSIQEVNQLIKQFEQMSKMMKMMQGGKGKHMMQMLQNMK